MTESLAFTGERFTPECVREIWYEHWHRYVFAARLADGKQVLDAACGEGYGSNLLARHAASVVGMDLSAAAVEHAQRRYGERGNLRFQQGDATALPFEAGSFDLVVSFETLEHLLAQEELLAGFARVLRPDGLLIISSPDKRTYSDQRGYQNEHHLRELYRDQFEALLARHFPARQLFGQKLIFDSAIWSLDGAPQRARFATADAEAGAVEPGIGLDPLYYIAIAAQRADAMPTAFDRSVDLFTDAAESVYVHYNHEVRKNMSAGGRIAELEAQCAQLQTRCSELQAQAAATAGATVAAPSRWRRFWSGGR